MNLLKDKRGSVFVWLLVTFGVFAIGMIYMLLTKPVAIVQQVTWDEVENQTDYAQTYNTVILMWKYWPILVLIGLIIFGIVASLKREPYTGYDGF